MKKSEFYDVIVIGAGHAGCEAARAASNKGASTLLLTTSLDTIAVLAGSATFEKNLPEFKELKRLRGLMPLVASKYTTKTNGLTMLDAWQYPIEVKYLLEKTSNLHLKQDRVTNISLSGKNIVLKTWAKQIFIAKAVVVATGNNILTQSLNMSGINNIFFAKQINGEENFVRVALQGLMVGKDAALRALGKQGVPRGTREAVSREQ
ncbi:MAG: FAD-binding protein [Actinobacteria bacterium]|nr:MAG: FAD-binding protein [Actinomycetota bacterium]